MLQIILFIFLGIIALILIAAVFMKKEYSISVSSVINKPQVEVFNYIKLLKNQE
ncbi:MAG: hypothetical protein ACEQSR_05610 [Candidatus Methylacidiphilales bacterium]